ncbi:hypothetical protein DRN32_06395 [Thermococci archaeon]|nr:MAG: hypothetical protein DRN32_06395 [Thermococci archaeon]
MSLFLHIIRSLGACLGLILDILIAIALLAGTIRDDDKQIRTGFLILLMLWLCLSLLYIIPYLTRIIAGG